MSFNPLGLIKMFKGQNRAHTSYVLNIGDRVRHVDGGLGLLVGTIAVSRLEELGYGVADFKAAGIETVGMVQWADGTRGGYSVNVLRPA